MTIVTISDELELTPEQVTKWETLQLAELWALRRARWAAADKAEAEVLTTVISVIWATPGARTLADVRAAREAQERAVVHRVHSWFRRLLWKGKIVSGRLVWKGVMVSVDISNDTTAVRAQSLAEALRTIGVEGEEEAVLQALEQSIVGAVWEEVEQVREEEKDAAAQRYLAQALLHILTTTAAQVREILTETRADLNGRLRSVFDVAFDVAFGDSGDGACDDDYEDDKPNDEEEGA